LATYFAPMTLMLVLTWMTAAILRLENWPLGHDTSLTGSTATLKFHRLIRGYTSSCRANCLARGSTKSQWRCMIGHTISPLLASISMAHLEELKSGKVCSIYSMTQHRS